MVTTLFNFIFSLIWGLAVWISPLVGTFLLGVIAWKLWNHYIQQDFISGIEWTLLEITPPRDVLRSPRGMELFFTNALYHWSMKGGQEEFWQGAVSLWFSLEIVSIDGIVHFYVRTPSRIKTLIETQMYAQYPQAQIKEVEDYTLAVNEITQQGGWSLWGCEWKLDKPDIFPIKTYVDYGLDKETKEEFKIDPISSVIELFGSIEKGEQMWLQIVVRPSKKKFHTGEKWFRHHDWVKEGELEIRKSLREFTRFHEDPMKPGSFVQEIRAPGFLEEQMKGAARKLTKIGFDTGIRTCYVAKKEAFSMNNRRNIRLIFRQYASPNSNSISRVNATQADAYSGYFPASQKTVMILSNRMLGKYRKRSFFHISIRSRILNKKTIFWPINMWVKPYSIPPTMVLNVEELATLWHFPGQILKVPTFERIESKEAAPPSNLPI